VSDRNESARLASEYKLDTTYSTVRMEFSVIAMTERMEISIMNGDSQSFGNSPMYCHIGVLNLHSKTNFNHMKSI